jgi:predicted MPP superfamily phosphohydrolase
MITIFILSQSGLLPLKIEVSRLLAIYSSGWIFFLFCFFLSLVFIDIVRVLNHFICFIPQIIIGNYVLFKFIIMILVLSATIFWYIFGYLNFITPERTDLDVFIDKPRPIITELKAERNLKIVFVSDIHIGYVINKRKLQEYVDSINSQGADIVFIAGDLCDGAIEPMIEQKVYEELSSIRARLGIYAVTGNHEYIRGNKDAKVSYYKKSGLIVLEDSVALIDSSFYVVGRKDRTDRNRKDIKELVKGLDTTLPIILLDHQPYNLDKSAEAGVDLHLSGHTHDGQFFPINLITRAIYEVSAGYKLKGKTHVYVSSGLGLWGPPVRIGTKSEFVVIQMRW